MLGTNKLIKLLIVEDSHVQCDFLIHILNSCVNINIVGIARNGYEAIEKVKELKPNIILMDLHMPKMNGIEAIKHIMAENPTPIVAMSASIDINDIINGYNALQAGAVAYAEKPVSVNHPNYQLLCDHLIETLLLMSEIKVVTRRDHPAKLITQTNTQPIQTISEHLINKNVSLIAIGVSTGGPLILQAILSKLPRDFPPILIVQHIIPGFIHSLVEWLSQSTLCTIEVAKYGQMPERGHVYFAPDHHHMGVMDDTRIFLQLSELTDGPCPSVGFLFNSVADALSKNAIGILLSGMGSDGAQQLKKMRDKGAITIAQSKETSLIYGMPGKAVFLGAAVYLMSTDEIAQLITSLSSDHS